MASKTRINRAEDSVREAVVARLRQLADQGLTQRQVAKQLGEEFPDVYISYDTVKNFAVTKDVRFFGGSKSEVGVRPATEEELPELVLKERRIQELTERLRDTGRKYKEAQRDETLAERLIAEALPALTTLRPVVPAVHAVPSKQTHSPQDAVCQISCLHMGEVVSPEVTNGLGNFSPELACARLQYYVDAVLDLTFNHHQGERIDTLWLVDVGDNGSGNIHEELKATNAFSLGDQLVRTSHLLSYALRDLAAHFKRVVFVGTVGNHMRFEKKPQFKDKVRNNGDWVIYEMTRALLADQKNVEFIIPDSPWAELEIQGRRFFFAHGDTIKMYMQFPWYDTSRFVAQMGQLIVAKGEIKKYPEYWGFGQFHQTTSSQLSYGRWMFTGSAKGPDEYSIGKLRAGVPPTWLFYGVHARRGRSFYYEIDMTEADAEVQNRYLSAAT